MGNLDWLSEAQMDRLLPYFPKSRGRARVDDRRVLNGIIFIRAMTESGVWGIWSCRGLVLVSFEQCLL
jgi:hypothetical protein